MDPFYSASRFLAGVALGLASGWKVTGREHTPPSGGLILASNHISFWDPPLVGAASVRGPYFLAKEELFRTPVLGPLIRAYHSIPIRRGVADLSGMTRALEVLKSGEVLLMFPEGTRMRDGELHTARPGVGMLAVNADVPVLPVYITGSNRPHRWWYRGTRVRIVFGRARPWRELAGPEADLTPGRALYQQVSDAVMREIAALKAGLENTAARGAAMSRTLSS